MLYKKIDNYNCLTNYIYKQIIYIMAKLFQNFSELYNTKYSTNIQFSGSIEAFEQEKDKYYVCINLIVKEYDIIIYNFAKDFHINEKTNSVFLNQYELINIYDKIHNNRTLFNIS